MGRARVLVSACLLGQKVRYDGGDKQLGDDLIARWGQEGRLVPFCPEVAGGLPTPRPPAEIAPATGRVIDSDGADVTDAFTAGAFLALDTARRMACRFALLTDGSPSCGSNVIYDGSFAGRKIPGAGITARLLRAHGVQVFGPAALSALAEALAATDRH